VGTARRSRLGWSLAIAGVLLIAAGYRLLASLDDFWLDEIWSWLLATRVQSATQIVTQIRHDNNHFLNTWVIYVLGTDRPWFWYRLPAVVAGIGTVAMCGVFARRWGRLGVLTAILITGASFPLIQYSSEARGYAYALLFAALGIELVQQSIDKPRLWADILFACCVMLGFLGQLTFAYAYGALVAWSVWCLFRRHGVWSSRHGAVLVWQILVPLAMLTGLYFVNLRHVAVGGGDEQPLLTVLAQSLSLAVGGPQADPGAALVALAVLVAAGITLVELVRSDSDLWLPLAAGALGLPALVLLLAGPAVLYPRYFLVSMLFLQLLVSWGLVRLFDRARFGKLLYLALLAAMLAGNAASTARLLAVGRGGYQAAVQFMLEHGTDEQLTVGSDHDFRNGLVLEYYFLRSGSPRRLAYFSQGHWPSVGPEWVLWHSQEPTFSPPQTFRDESGQTYSLQAVFPYAGLSGWHWAVYRNRNRPGNA